MRAVLRTASLAVNDPGRRCVSPTLLVAIGGLAGSVARYWFAGWVQTRHAGIFPVGTLAVNAAGCFVLGLVMGLSIDRGLAGAPARLLLGVGFCGGFTTMSAFSYETIVLLQHGRATLALLNAGGTMAVCLAAVWLGGVVARSG